jgi:serine/threonine-protein kinase RsbW
MHEGSITISISADVHEIERLNRLIRKFGELHDLPSRALYSINLALDEVVSNVVLYGYGEAKGGGPIVVKLEIKGTELMASVEDAGREFDPLSLPAPDLNAALEDRQIGGLGIHLMRSLMDRVDYQHVGGKNLLSMRKRVR